MIKAKPKYLMASYKSDRGARLPGASVSDKAVTFVDIEVIETDDSLHIAAVRSRMMRKANVRGVLIVSFENMRKFNELLYQHV